MAASTGHPDPGADPGAPPAAPRHPVERVLHGVRSTDDYAWMRDHTDPQLLEYLSAERAHYERAAAGIAGLAEDLQARIVARTPPSQTSVSWMRGGLEYYTRTDEGREYPALYRRPPGGSADTERLLVDLEHEAAGHEYAELGLTEVSPDGRWLAWSIDTTGDEVFQLRFRDLESGRDLPDRIGRSYYTGAWSADSRSFFYLVHDSVYRPYLVCRHLLGTDPTDDEEVFREDDRAYDVTVRATRSGAFIVIRTENRDTAECHLIPAARPGCAPAVVWPRHREIEYDVEHAGPDAGSGRLFAVTNAEAVEFRLLALDLQGDLEEGRPGAWREIVAGRDDVRLVSADAFAGHLVTSARRGGRTLLEIRDHDGGLRHELTCPVPEGTLGLATNEEYGSGTVTVRTASLIEPATWWDVDLGSGGWTVRHRTPVPEYLADDYVTQRIEAEAPDGTAVPVTVARRRSTPVDGTAPCLLYGYGSYESSSDPDFEVTVSALLDLGAVFAVAHVRGGGELGRRWWLGGRLHTKPNTFSDFVAAGRALIAGGFAAPDRLAARGLSAGGLLMAASLALAPDLWRAVVAEVPFVDVIGSMLDPGIPLTINEWDEWGDPRRADDFAVMRSYSPYDNPPAGRRPALLVTGAVNDARVLVHEPAKWVARLRATAAPDSGELLFRPELGEGAHTGPAGRYSRAGYEAEILAWVLDRLSAGGSGSAAGGDDERDTVAARGPDVTTGAGSG